MKTRIEVWVDADVPQSRIEEFRKYLEDCNWAAVRNWENVALIHFVQANEIPTPPMTIDEICDWAEAQKPCTSA